MNIPVYLDCSATTPVEPSVAAVAAKFTEKDYGNAASPVHDYGLFARTAADHARKLVGQPAGAGADSVVFTSGATESNNLAILGLAEEGTRTGRRHIITTAIEHKSVLEPAAAMERFGFRVDHLPAGADGRFDVNRLAELLRPDTLLVSTMHVNNETGIIQPLKETAEVLAGHEAYWHVDSAQGYGKEFTMLTDGRIDMISVSGHKIYAPKGIGALIMRRRDGRFPPLMPLMYGGGQEQGLRPGTLPVQLIAAFGEAAKLAMRDGEARRQKCIEYRRAVLSVLDELGAQQNGDERFCMPHTVNFSLKGIKAETAVRALKSVIAVSGTSACTSHNPMPSYVLGAMGLSAERVECSLRFSWCHMTPDADWERVKDIIRKLRSGI
ncbi:aminotransferase class V-fold PLP-dependent enzyme [Seleniivibrio woodruffii]|uniref:aminotransferase class V-fold PLP-dependent enzyme n=1 Tax=Seleniivibrio woodruffii TaxID=1078050 RepID=UPI0039E6F81D